MFSQVYGLALYVERQTAAAELARLNSEGFFADGDYGVERMCAAIAALKCDKASPCNPITRRACLHSDCIRLLSAIPVCASGLAHLLRFRTLRFAQTSIILLRIQCAENADSSFSR